MDEPNVLARGQGERGAQFIAPQDQAISPNEGAMNWAPPSSPSALGSQEALAYRKKFRGMIGVASKVPLKDRSVLSLLYTPGVAAPCLEIAKEPLTSFDYTMRGNTIVLVTDGSSAFGLGNIGPLAALPMLEDACILFKSFGGVDAFPICLATQDVEEIIATGMAIWPTFGGICLSSIT